MVLLIIILFKSCKFQKYIYHSWTKHRFFFLLFIIKLEKHNNLTYEISMLTGFVTRLTRRVSLVEQELLTLPENLSSPPVFSGVHVTRSLVLCVCFVDRCLSFCTFSFGHYVVCPSSIYGFWLPHWYRQTLLTPARILVLFITHSFFVLNILLYFVRFSSLNKSHCNVVHSSLLCTLICTRFLYNSCQYHLLKDILRRCLLNYQTFVNRIGGVMVSVLASDAR